MRAGLSRFTIALVLALVLALVAPAALALAEPGARGPAHWVLLVSQNEGDVSDEPLRYADADAALVRDALTDMGTLQPDRTLMVRAATPQAVRQAMSALRARLDGEARSDDRLFVYVSAHADGSELHLAGERLPLRELTSFLREAPVGFGLLLLDACRAGALTRLKGLKPARGVALSVGAASVEGRVIITSSGPDESSRESDELQGSTFTHHWVMGLRGAADASRDGRVSLQEAYAYAYARTVDSTVATRGGLQRASYHWDLRGHGDVVLTELTRATATLQLEVSEPGAWQVLSLDGRRFIADVEKPKGFGVLALPPGPYLVRTTLEGEVLERRVRLVKDARVSIRRGELEVAPPGAGRLKGAGQPLTVSVGLTASTGLLAGLSLLSGGEARLHLGTPGTPGELARLVDTFSVAVSLRTGRGANLIRFSHTELEARAGLWHSLGAGWLSGRGGIELGALLASQGEVPVSGARQSLAGTLSGGLEAMARVQRSWGLFVSLGFGGVLLRVDGGLVARVRASGLAGGFLRL